MSAWPVFVINMDENTDRMSRVTAELSGLDIPFTRFSAVNGRAIPEDELARIYDARANARRARHPMIAAEIGCYLSHIALWRRIAAGDHQGGIVLEDDFTASDALPAVLDALAGDEGDWEIAKLFTLNKDQRLLERRPLVGGSEIVVPYKVPTTTLGYAIRKGAATRLAGAALPVSRPIDEDHKHFWELGLRVASVMPPPLQFSESSFEDGSIQSARRRTSRLRGGAKLAQAWRTFRYRLRYVAGLHWHRLVKRAR
ncbi:glycosyl transferase family 25 [Rhodobacterales bacterium HKCCSP123]|nr:glycosyl transferase family 25 [Rhodobacterales bacterium HKCCSP123]